MAPCKLTFSWTLRWLLGLLLPVALDTSQCTGTITVWAPQPAAPLVVMNISAHLTLQLMFLLSNSLWCFPSFKALSLSERWSVAVDEQLPLGTSMTYPGHMRLTFFDCFCHRHTATWGCHILILELISISQFVLHLQPRLLSIEFGDSAEQSRCCYEWHSFICWRIFLNLDSRQSRHSSCL